MIHNLWSNFCYSNRDITHSYRLPDFWVVNYYVDLRTFFENYVINSQNYDISSFWPKPLIYNFLSKSYPVLEVTWENSPLWAYRCRFFRCAKNDIFAFFNFSSLNTGKKAAEKQLQFSVKWAPRQQSRVVALLRQRTKLWSVSWPMVATLH